MNNTEGLLSEQITFKQVAAPADANGAAIVGARIKMSKGFKLAIVVAMGDSAAAVANFSLLQHDAASAGNSKALEITNHYYTKVAGAASFTKNVVAVAASAYDLSAVFAANEGIVVFEVLAEDLDVNEDFAYVSLNIADSTAAKVFAGIYELHDLKNGPAYEVEV